MTGSDAALALRGIDKRFGPVHANRGAGLIARAGTVHALVGENGAGKSTLMKIAYGHVRADAGDIEIKGERVSASYSPREAIARGIGMVHQHFMLIGTLTVAENAILGREPVRRGLVDLGRASRELAELSSRHGLDVDPGARVEDLSVGEQQRVEILKVLWQGADVLILDEPTAVLTPAEVDQLFDVVRSLVGRGVTVVLITHKLDEVASIADRVTVMRRGEVVSELGGGEASPEELARAMVGRPVLLEVDRQPAAPGRPVLDIEGLEVAGRGGAPAVDIASLEVRAGEIVGVAGVEGNGQSELVGAICGLRAISRGSVRIGGREVTRDPVKRRHDAGLAHIPEDRHARGLVLEMTVADNAILGRQREFSNRLGIDRRRVDEAAAAAIRDFDIRPGDPEARAAGLSGGNQQKIVVARELTRPAPRLLVAAQPTRGVDIGAIERIHRAIVAARDAGLGVLLVSAELAELRALADRLVVLYRGRISGSFTEDELREPGAQDRVGALMTGAGVAAGAEA